VDVRLGSFEIVLIMDGRGFVKQGEASAAPGRIWLWRKLRKQGSRNKGFSPLISRINDFHGPVRWNCFFV
jgi:hypothetical protein